MLNHALPSGNVVSKHKTITQLLFTINLNFRRVFWILVDAEHRKIFNVDTDSFWQNMDFPTNYKFDYAHKPQNRK